MNKKETSWDKVANWYDGLLEGSNDSFQTKVILPNLTRILDIKPGMRILDVACGQGYFSRLFSAAGAKVTGVDISSELIALAKEHTKRISFTPISTATAIAPVFHVASSDDLNFAKPETFDVCIVVLSLQNIENLQETLSECSRVLTHSGRLIIVLNHPTFRIPKRSSWDWDLKANKQYRRIDSYLSDSNIEIDMTPGEKNLSKKKTTLSFHRPLQSYFKVLNKTGFVVSRLEEWISHKKSQNGPRATEEDRIRKEIPMFLMIEATKT